MGHIKRRWTGFTASVTGATPERYVVPLDDLMMVTAVSEGSGKSMSGSTCQHFNELTTAADPISKVCDQCVAIGDSWVHLRSCLHCGAVGCCDNSKNRHARKHWEEQHHPLIRSIELGESWRYCFPDHFLLR